ncbi:MAG: UDP-N-acetylmuramate--L-alanine ligase [Planctomycetota bacterium]
MDVVPAFPQPPQTPAWLLLGICGAGMRSFAQHLVALNIPVVGSDSDHDALNRARSSLPAAITLLEWSAVQRGHTPSISTVVHSVAVAPWGPELNLLRCRGIRILSLPTALAHQFASIPQLCVAGTHGKSTTTGMLWWILHHAGCPTARYVGAEFQSGDPAPLPGSPNSPFSAAVLESCEYRDSFLALQPSQCVLTGIEPDHFDWFTTPSAATRSYAAFLNRTIPGGAFIYSADCPTSSMLAGNFVSGPVISWSAASRPAVWQLTPHAPHAGCLNATGTLQRADSRDTIQLQLRVPGEHNLRNATAALLAAIHRGIPAPEAAHWLSTFPGMRRRFEYRGTWRGADLFDDYAHHPTAVDATLRTIRRIFPDRQVVVVFEPHQLSRTHTLLQPFAQSLALADRVIVTPVLAARETAPPAARRELAQELVRRICQIGGRASLVGDLDRVPENLDHAVRAGDILITMGAGRTNLIHDEIHRTIPRDSAA